MISPGNEPQDSPMTFLPHQSALLETFFNPTSNRVILLRGDVGLGKTATLVALASRLLLERPKARVLFLVPAALQSQFVEILHRAASPTLLVDRYRFREMLDSTTEDDFWPSGMVCVLSRDFAKQPDILDSLSATHWDLVIADEAHSFRGTGAKALRKVAESADRVVLATAIPVDDAQFDAFPIGDAVVVEWRRDKMVDHEGKPLDTGMPPALHGIPFSLNAAELSLRAIVNELCETLGSETPVQNFTVMMLLRQLESSPAALEGALQRLAERLHILGQTHEDFDEPLENLEEDMPEDLRYGPLDGATAKKVLEITRRALQEIDAIGVDSKLSAFDQLLSDLHKTGVPSRRFCVLTQFVGTLYYLAAEIEGRGMECQLMHGGMGVDERSRSLDLFGSTEGILVATTGSVKEGFGLAEVTDLIFYDIPGNKIELQQLMDRFNLLGRHKRQIVYVFMPSDSLDSLTARNIALLRDLIAG